ncbi:MAG: hypothetical protein MHM6MM_008901, partial [Cercozoa sp. M6MM]
MALAESAPLLLPGWQHSTRAILSGITSSIAFRFLRNEGGDGAPWSLALTVLPENRSLQLQLDMPASDAPECVTRHADTFVFCTVQGRLAHVDLDDNHTELIRVSHVFPATALCSTSRGLVAVSADGRIARILQRERAQVVTDLREAFNAPPEVGVAAQVSRFVRGLFLQPPRAVDPPEPVRVLAAAGAAQQVLLLSSDGVFRAVSVDVSSDLCGQVVTRIPLTQLLLQLANNNDDDDDTDLSYVRLRAACMRLCLNDQ